MNKFSGLLGALALAVVAPLAHANFVIAYSLNGGTIQPCANSPLDTVASCFTAGQNIGSGVTITNASGTSNSSGSPAGAQQFDSTTTITTTTSGATLILYYAAQNFIQPVTGGGVTAIHYTSQIGATNVSLVGGGSTSITLESCIDEANGTVTIGALPAASGFCTTPAATITNPLQTLPGTPGASVNNTTKIDFAPLGSPYSLGQMVTLALAANTSINLSTSQSLTPVPEPFSIALLGGVILLTTRSIRRKRNQIS